MQRELEAKAKQSFLQRHRGTPGCWGAQCRWERALCPPAPYPQSWDVLAAHGLPTPLTFSKPRLKKPEEPPGTGRSHGLAVLPILYHSDRRETSFCSYSVSELGRNQQEQRPAYYGRNKADPLGPRQEQDSQERERCPGKDGAAGSTEPPGENPSPAITPQGSRHPPHLQQPWHAAS